ncbi:hypothetical protein CASFOL_015210 [Castilleja foliolosa]|uniref:Uncharacterized protein n=1 Tax=Castilleja foliolosa TaxID=1961234 RepID=A0ABD3DDY4_9LAMI
MFSKHTYLLHQDSPNSGGSTSMVNEILLHDLLSGHYPDPPVLFNQDDLGHGPTGDPSSLAHICPKSAKKDRHSKIHTAQGPRDRRVRLSIGVARKFFDLQEMLGFDKPSKTLDWLLTKSKSAIKHLVHTKQSSKSVISSLSECDEINNNNNNNFDVDEINKSSRKRGKSVTSKKIKDPHQQAALNIVKESRVKARARARERTREKMSIKQQLCINEYDQMGPGQGPIQYMNNQLEMCRMSGYEAVNHHQDDLIQESNVIKRKVKHNNNSPLIFGFQPGYNNIPSVNYNSGTENWDISNFAASQSGLCAILDQHRFNINSLFKQLRRYFWSTLITTNYGQD